MLIEMHCHTKEHSSCSKIPAVELVRQSYAKSLQGIIFTDHYYLWTLEELNNARIKSGVPPYFIILSGQEIRIADFGDLIIYGADKIISKEINAQEIKKKHPGCAIIWAHPYEKGKKPLEHDLKSPLIDAVEIFSSNHSIRENIQALMDWHKYKFTAVGGTDTHGNEYAGTYPTQFDHPVENIPDICEEIKNRRCRPHLKEIPRSGANVQITDLTIGSKGLDEKREKIIIKAVRDKIKWESSRRAYKIMDTVSRHGFENGTYRVPIIYEADEESRTLVEQGLRGRTLFDKILSSNLKDSKKYLRMTAQWLARLHNLKLCISKPEEFHEKEISRLEKYYKRFNETGSPHKDRANQIIEFLKEEENKLFLNRRDSFIQGHGDFHPKNVIIGQDIQDNRDTLFVAAIDFDGSYCMPSAFDAGCFIAQFKNQFFNNAEIMEFVASEVFLNEYMEYSLVLGSDFLRQVELFKARTNLSIAAYLIKLGLGESQNLWRVIIDAEKHASAYSSI